MRKSDDSKKSVIVEYINEYYSDYGQTPTVRAISEGTGIAVATVHRYEKEEMVDGKVASSSGKSRTASSPTEYAVNKENGGGFTVVAL